MTKVSLQTQFTAGIKSLRAWLWPPVDVFDHLKALYTGQTDCGGERVLVKALPATWWEIPARPQHLHGSAET